MFNLIDRFIIVLLLSFEQRQASWWFDGGQCGSAARKSRCSASSSCTDLATCQPHRRRRGSSQIWSSRMTTEVTIPNTPLYAFRLAAIPT